MVETTRRREIEDAASSLFREHGYSGTSVRDIARALDIQGASLYAHVTSKQEVLWSIVERMAERFEEAADAGMASVGPVADAGARLASLVRAHVDVVTDDIERASVFVHEWRSLAGAMPTRPGSGRSSSTVWRPTRLAQWNRPSPPPSSSRRSMDSSPGTDRMAGSIRPISPMRTRTSSCER